MQWLPARLALPLGMMVLAAAAPAFAQADGPVTCYRVNDPVPQRAFTLTVTNAGVTQSCRVKTPARLGCLGTQISGVAPVAPGAPSPGMGGDFLCYRIHCPRPFPPAVTKSDAFGGERLVRFKRAQLLCTPTGIGSSAPSPGVPATTTTTGPGTSVPPTTTTTVAPQPCEFHDGTCTGTCGNGGHCSAVAAGGACECRTTACGDANAPACRGFCARDQACIFNLTGCGCVAIP